MNKEELALKKYPVISSSGTKEWYKQDTNAEKREIFIAGYEAKEAEDKWIPIEQYKGGKILRWHKLWKCVVEVESLKEFPFFQPSDFDWITATRDNTWKEESFEPYFMNPTPPPKQ